METVAGVAASIGLGLLGKLFGSSGRAPPAIGFDEQPTTVSQRGSYIPIIVGRVMVPPARVYAGARASRKVGSGKGPDGGGSQRIYREAGWDIIGVGPGTKLHAILASDIKIYEGPLLASGAASGTTFTTIAPHAGTGYIHWGETDQPVNTRLGAGTGTGTAGAGVTSRWPRMWYVDWRSLEIGGSPVWPNLLFDAEMRHDAGIVDAPAWIEESSLGAGDDGNNAAHAMLSLMTERFPLGMGIPCPRVWCACFNELAVAVGDGVGGERLPVNFAVETAAEGVEVIARMLIDLGAMMPETGARLAPRLLRRTADDMLGGLPVLTRDAIGPGPAERERAHPPLEADRVTYVFRDRKINYREQPIEVDDDGAVSGTGRVRPRRQAITTITDAATARRCADRRADEDLAPKRPIKLGASRAAVDLLPGQQFILRELGQPDRLCVVNSTTRRPGRHFAEINAVEMLYGGEVSGAPPEVPPDPPGSGVVEADLIFEPQELPHAIVRSDDIRVAVLRVRADATIVGARIIGSATGSTYQEVGDEPGYCFGGTLAADVDAGRTIIGRAGDGPVIDAYNDDIGEAEDLSDAALLNDWLSGRQLCIVGTGADAEVWFVRSLTSVGGGQHRLNEVIRGRMDTDQKDWPAGTPVLFFGPLATARVTPLASPALFQRGLTPSIKALPRNGAIEIDPADVTAETVEIVGRAARPLPVFNLRANGEPHGSATYPAAGDIDFTWNYRVRDGLGAGAGEAPSGAVGAAPRPSREGPFEVEIWTSGTLKRTLTLNSDATDTTGVSYENADNASDHSGTPAALVEARVYHTRGTYRSRVRTIEVTKV